MPYLMNINPNCDSLNHSFNDPFLKNSSIEFDGTEWSLLVHESDIERICRRNNSVWRSIYYLRFDVSGVSPNQKKSYPQIRGESILYAIPKLLNREFSHSKLNGYVFKIPKQPLPGPERTEIRLKLEIIKEPNFDFFI